MGGFTPYEKYNTLCISVLQNHPSHTLGFATTTRQQLASARSSAHKKKKRPTLFSRPLCISGRKAEVYRLITRSRLPETVSMSREEYMFP